MPYKHEVLFHPEASSVGTRFQHSACIQRAELWRLTLSPVATLTLSQLFHSFFSYLD